MIGLKILKSTVSWFNTRIAFKSMIRRNLLLFSLIPFLTTSLVKAESGYQKFLEEFGGEPVEAIRVLSPTNQGPITLFGLGVDGITVTYPGFEGKMDLPEDNLPFVIEYRPQITFQEYQNKLDAGQREEALTMLRRELYPLLQYVNMDTSAIRIHNFVARVLREMLRQGQSLEVYDILTDFSRDRVTGGFREIAIDTAKQLLDKGDVERAYRLTRRFPVGPGAVTFAPIYLDMANQFRLLEDWERARNLYTDVQMASNQQDTPEAFLWEAYIHIQEDRSFMAESILDDFASISDTSPYYALIELVRGIILEEQGDTQDALSTLAKSLVYSTTNDVWTPELLFRVANLYEKMDEPTPAREIRRQLVFFYPDSIWAQQLP